MMKTKMSLVFLTACAVILALTNMLMAQDIDRTIRPVGKPAPKVALPAIQKAELQNGLNVWLVEHHELPTVALNLVIQAGADHDPLTMPGLASLTADMIDEATKTKDALQISEAIESIGANFGTSSSFDGSFMTLNTLTKHIDKALAVFADVLLNPTFPQKDFERIRKQRLGQLLQQKDQPVTIANNAYSLILYGSDHPYGNNPSGSEASLKGMTTEDLKRFYSAYYRPNNATLIIVGDLTMKEIIGKLNTNLADWKKGDIASFTIPAPRVIDSMRVYLVDKPGAPQSEVRIGYPALARNTPDYFPVLLMNRLLGGQFTSRINLNLREKHGYTYGARSGFSFQKGAGPFTASGGIVTEKTDSSLIEFLYEINLMKKKGMSASELEFVKKGLVGGFALGFETPAQIAGSLQNIVLYGLPENYFNNYLQNIESVTLADIQRVSSRYLDTGKMDVVVVGDLSKIKDGVTKLNLGPVILADVDGKPIQ